LPGVRFSAGAAALAGAALVAGDVPEPRLSLMPSSTPLTIDAQL
jgi:hypothetical protein